MTGCILVKCRGEKNSKRGQCVNANFRNVLRTAHRADLNILMKANKREKKIAGLENDVSQSRRAQAKDQRAMAENGRVDVAALFREWNS